MKDLDDKSLKKSNTILHVLELEVCDDVGVELPKFVSILELRSLNECEKNFGELVPKPLHVQLMKVVQKFREFLE
jgi:hypothetical protein